MYVCVSLPTQTDSGNVGYTLFLASLPMFTHSLLLRRLLFSRTRSSSRWLVDTGWVCICFYNHCMHVYTVTYLALVFYLCIFYTLQSVSSALLCSVSVCCCSMTCMQWFGLKLALEQKTQIICVDHVCVLCAIRASLVSYPSSNC